jgi:hypothetical protein
MRAGARITVRSSADPFHSRVPFGRRRQRREPARPALGNRSTAERFRTVPWDLGGCFRHGEHVGNLALVQVGVHLTSPEPDEFAPQILKPR